MRVAYLVSKYPAVSHTFVLREVQALRQRGLEVGTFSVRRATRAEVLGPEAQQEAASTRWLVPPGMLHWMAATGLACTRPRQVLGGFCWAVKQPGGFRGKAMGLAYLAEAVLLARWIRRDGFEHIHCHFGNAGSTTAMLAAELAGVPFSLTVHGSELFESRRYQLAEKVARAAFVACVSWHGRAQLMMITPDEQWAKLHIVRCGLAGLPEPSRPVTGAAGHDAPRSKEVLCVGRLSSEKGHRVLLEAVALLRDRGVELRCTIVGDGPLRAELEAYALSRKALDGHVTFAGALPVGDVIERYRTADVVVLASFSEGVPMVLIEALALGRPVVATAVGGVPELVRDRETGLVVPPGNAAALADAMQWVVEHPVESAALGLAGAALVQREFDLAASASTLHELFSHGCAATSRPASLAAEPEGQPSHGSGEPSPGRFPTASQLPRRPGAVRSREPVSESSTSAPTRQAPTSADQS
jgi:glycosyltransferase involved in cell wall biosynthesis